MGELAAGYQSLRKETGGIVARARVQSGGEASFMGPNTRGFGTHRSWLPWVSVNHLYGITGLEEFDPVLYQQLAKGQ